MNQPLSSTVVWSQQQLMDRLVQRSQELADLYVRVLELEPETPVALRQAYERDLLQAYARYALVSCSATSQITGRFLSWDGLAATPEDGIPEGDF